MSVTKLGFLIRFACERLPGILTEYVVCGSVVLHDLSVPMMYTRFTAEQSKLTVNGSALSDTPKSVTRSNYTLGQVWYLIVSIPDPCCLSYSYFELYIMHLIIQLYVMYSLAKPRLYMCDAK